MTDLEAFPILALSVRQPWAWAIIHAGKDVENRSRAAERWACTGRVAIHAAKGMTQAEYYEAASFMASIGVTCPPPAELVRGAVIGAVTIRAISGDDWGSPWAFGPCHLHLEKPEPIDPIPARGALGLFGWTPSPDPRAEPDEPAIWMRKWQAQAEDR
jgi:hypothetical protein